jgi:hypothetical protein
MVTLPAYASTLCNLYWQLRARRSFDLAKRRRFYRYISDEKKRLFLEGVEKEEIRLLCRYLANPTNKHAELAFSAYAAQMRLPFANSA